MAYCHFLYDWYHHCNETNRKSFIHSDGIANYHWNFDGTPDSIPNIIQSVNSWLCHGDVTSNHGK